MHFEAFLNRTLFFSLVNNQCNKSVVCLLAGDTQRSHSADDLDVKINVFISKIDI